MHSHSFGTSVLILTAAALCSNPSHTTAWPLLRVKDESAIPKPLVESDEQQMNSVKDPTRSLLTCAAGQYITGSTCFSCPYGTFQAQEAYDGNSCTYCAAGHFQVRALPYRIF